MLLNAKLSIQRNIFKIYVSLASLILVLVYPLFTGFKEKSPSENNSHINYFTPKESAQLKTPVPVVLLK